MAFPATSTLDDFARADTNHLANTGPWGAETIFNENDMGISGGLAYAPAGPCSQVTAATFGPDCEVWATIEGNPIADEHGLYLRFDRNDNGYVVAVYGPTTIRLFRLVNGSFFPLADRNDAFSPGDQLGLRATGTNPVHLEVFRNGVSLFTYDDSDAARIVAAGSLAMEGSATTRFSDFGGGTYSPAVTHDAAATLALSSALSVSATREKVGAATLAIATSLHASATVSTTSTAPATPTYDADGYPTDDDRARQDALGAELLRAWSPLLTGFKKQDKQGARVDRGFGPKEPPIVPPGATV